jgi:hypothetical protein
MLKGGNELRNARQPANQFAGRGRTDRATPYAEEVEEAVRRGCILLV